MSRVMVLLLATVASASLPVLAQTSSTPNSSQATAGTGSTDRDGRPTASGRRSPGAAAARPAGGAASSAGENATAPNPPGRRLAGKPATVAARAEAGALPGTSSAAAGQAGTAAVAERPTVERPRLGRRTTRARPEPASPIAPASAATEAQLLPQTNWFSTFFGGQPAQARGERLPALAGRGQIDALIAHHAKLNGVPESLVHRVVVRESKYNPRAVGAGGAMGLMQIKTATARGVGYGGGATGLLDAETNITYAVKYLAGAYRTADGNHDLAVGYYARGYFYDAKRKGMIQTASGETVHASHGRVRDGQAAIATRPAAFAEPAAAPTRRLARTFAGARPALPSPAVTASAEPGPPAVSPAMDRAAR